MGEFNSPAGIPQKKDGAGPSSYRHTGMKAARTRERERHQAELLSRNPDSNLPEISSPAKQRRRISESEEHVNDLSIDNDPMFSGNPFNEKQCTYPTSDHPVIDTDLKDMALSLRRALQHDMCTFMQKSKMEMYALEERVDYCILKLKLVTLLKGITT